MSFDAPNYTEIPNDFIENHMRDLNRDEMIVMMLIFRHTNYKTIDKVDLNKISNVCYSLSKVGIFEAYSSLKEKGILKEGSQW